MFLTLFPAITGIILIFQSLTSNFQLSFTSSNFKPPTSTIFNAPSQTKFALMENIATASSEIHKVIRVIDGDTIELENKERVRYIGINTPETVDPRRPVQCFGLEAKQKNKELVEGKAVRLETDVSNKDKYGRLLRYVYVGDNFINLLLVQEGYAQTSTFPPNVKYQLLFLEAEKEARAKKLGLWNKCKK
ncbi:MAG: Thermonuclease [Candidatus Gottesmanbacteria bacterium GW2011_GWA2_41_12]|uniref:Thermonuclease n=2 Tax=Candidatus Gottesmaniibacteriota TaxID=1752720 RepID=A0A0G0WW06_9BACT|nr:MAG: Thermonuclease [Candidatus Gottesmanbacteria bacterium GW2011_GWA2_41_12]